MFAPSPQMQTLCFARPEGFPFVCLPVPLPGGGLLFFFHPLPLSIRSLSFGERHGAGGETGERDKVIPGRFAGTKQRDERERKSKYPTGGSCNILCSPTPTPLQRGMDGWKLKIETQLHFST